MSKISHILLTGGVGSRLWPLSRRSRPKQYLEIFSGNSLFELAIKRNRSFSNQLIIVGNKDNGHLSEKVINKLNVQEYTHIKEATPRNTASAIAFAAFSTRPENLLLVTPADHIIEEGIDYEKAIEKAVQLAEQDFLVTFGVRPDKPETGYGYIESDKDNVLAFHEKPDKKTAEDFLKSRKFLWNSGMFCFKASVFLEELQEHAPLVYERSLNAWKEAEENCLRYSSSIEIPSISVDYAVMEKSKKIKVVNADFKWSDMGSFDAVYTYLIKEGYPIDDRGNMVIGSNTFTAFVGMRNSILIFSENANLVLQKEVSQEVKTLYQDLETLNSPFIQ